TGAFSLSLSGSGTIVFGANSQPSVASINSTVANLSINTATVTTSGAQTYNSAISLGANTSLISSSSGNINLSSTVDGAFGLTVNTAGITTFGGIVGGTTALTSLTTNA